MTSSSRPIILVSRWGIEIPMDCAILLLVSINRTSAISGVLITVKTTPGLTTNSLLPTGPQDAQPVAEVPRARIAAESVARPRRPGILPPTLLPPIQLRLPPRRSSSFKLQDRREFSLVCIRLRKRLGRRPDLYRCLG